MTAQQQLATLLAAPDEAHALFGDAALKFLRDHGPVFDELFKAYIARQSAVAAFRKPDAGRKERADAYRNYDAADDAIFAALRKLTQDA